MENIRIAIKRKSTYADYEDFLSAIKNKRGKIIAYHGTKMFSDDAFSDGLSFSESAVIKRLARQVFRSDDGLLQKRIDGIIDGFKINFSGQLHYCLNKDLFIRCDHYLMFGGENLLVLADRLRESIPQISFRNLLYKIGKPTIVHFQIDIVDLSKIEVDEICEMINDILLERNKSISLHRSFIHKKCIPIQNIIKLETRSNVINVQGLPIY
jgi:hypothetical protein